MQTHKIDGPFSPLLAAVGASLLRLDDATAETKKEEKTERGEADFWF
jgi:hypothetical protein